MENTMMNMTLILEEMEKGLKNGNTSSVKTLANTYQTLFKKAQHEIYSDVKGSGKWIIDFSAHRNYLVRLIELSDKELTSSIVGGRHKDSNDIATILDKLNRSIRDIGYFSPKRTIVTKKEFSVSQLTQDLLDLSIKTGTLVTFYDETHRGTGKTTALIKKAYELDAVLITSLKTQAKYTEMMAQEMGLSITVISIYDVRGRRMENGYLVDEMVDLKELNNLKEYKLLGGFNRVVI